MREKGRRGKLELGGLLVAKGVFVEQAAILPLGARVDLAVFVASGERAAELEFGEAEAIAELIGGACKALEFFAAAGIKKIELLRAGRKGQKLDPDEPQHCGAVPGENKKAANRAQNDFVEVSWFAEGLTAGDGAEIGVAQRDAYGARSQASIAQSFRRFLREVAESRFKQRAIVRIDAKSLVMRNRFGFGVDEKFVGVDAVRFAEQRGAPAAKRIFQAIERKRL